MAHTPATAITARTWMNTRVRVLNATYEDFDVVPAAHAVVLVAEELAVTLVEHTPRFVVRSQHVAVPLPRTIQLLEYVHTPAPAGRRRRLARPVPRDPGARSLPVCVLRPRRRPNGGPCSAEKPRRRRVLRQSRCRLRGLQRPQS